MIKRPTNAAAKHPAAKAGNEQAAGELHFGRWLRREIENRLLTIEKFALQAHLDPSSLHGILKKARPNLRGTTIVRIANALELSREQVEAQLGPQPTSAAA